jgi:hypothetical protein
MCISFRAGLGSSPGAIFRSGLRRGENTIQGETALVDGYLSVKTASTKPRARRTLRPTHVSRMRWYLPLFAVDGLKGFPQAIEALYPQTEVQLCIVHLVRASLNYVPWKYRKLVAADLRPIARYAARSLTSADVADLAQWAQQKKRPPTSTPCPITLHLQCSQMGAIAWIAHSKLSKVCRAPAAISSKLLSYSLPQTSHVAIPNLLHSPLTDELRSWSTRC